MILSIFSNQNIMHLLEIFFWMLGAFLIGLYFGKLINTNKEKQLFDNEDFEDINIKDDISKIRATKTFERGGKEMVTTVPSIKDDNELNFDSIGIASIETKNNLQKIKGIGPSIENKLNKIGIYTYLQISNFNSKDINKVTELLKFFPGRIERDDWVGQAFKLLNHNNHKN
jgi:predicted flap endonuclease-1-like 5' DNA nuclease